LTLWRVLRREGISPAAEAIMPRFMGSPIEAGRPQADPARQPE
jgi:hypothetical protein